MKRLLLVLATCLFGLASGQAFAGSLTVTGNLPRDLAEGIVNFDVTVVNITQAEYDKGAAAPGFAKRFKVFLTELSSTTELKATADGVVEPVLAYLSERQAAEEQQQSDGTWKYIYRLQIRETQGGFLKTKFPSGKMSLKVQFFLGEALAAETTTNAVLEQSVYIVKPAPSFDGAAPIVGSHKSLRVSFATPGAVEVLPSAAGTKEPTFVNAYVVDLSVVTGSVTLPAKKFGGATAADTAASCTFTPPSAGSGACVDCGATGDVFLDESAIGSVAGFSLSQAAAKDGGVTIAGLENEKRYAVFLQYEPDGVGVTACLPGQPSPNFTLTELNGEGEAEVVDFRCFIATAAYGSRDHKDVVAFRRFRDQHLLHTGIGQTLVALYYELSPPLAGFLDEHPNLKPYVRGVLAIPATILRWTDDVE